MTDKKILFGRAAEEDKIQNIDELCKNIDLEENSKPEEVHIQILKVEEQSIRISKTPTELRIPIV